MSLVHSCSLAPSFKDNLETLSSSVPFPPPSCFRNRQKGDARRELLEALGVRFRGVVFCGVCAPLPPGPKVGRVLNHWGMSQGNWTPEFADFCLAWLEASPSATREGAPTGLDAYRAAIL